MRRSIRSLSIAACAAALLTAGAAAASPSLTNAAFFDADATGANTSASPQVTRGGWTTVLDQQNVSGNYGAEFFLATTATPAPADFITPSTALSAALSEGANTFYFWADGDDTAGGTAGFGLNLFLNGANTGAPSISAFTTVGGTAVADSGACTMGYAFNCNIGTGSLSFVDGNITYTLTDFQVIARGGGAGGVDLVNSTNTAPFAPPPHADGINDTYGSFTLNVSTAATGPTGGVPEPASWALMLLGFGGLGAALRTRRRALGAA